jgi:hypothetical protein
MRRILTLAVFVIGAFASAQSATADDCSNSWAPGPAQVPHAFTYRDGATGIQLYVESDGRHLAAFSPEGDLLWVRNPFEDKHLCPYRVERPIIWRIVPFPESLHARVAGYLKRAGPFVQIEFDSSQFGAIDLPTGDFQPMGQN